MNSGQQVSEEKATDSDDETRALFLNPGIMCLTFNIFFPLF